MTATIIKSTKTLQSNKHPVQLQPVSGFIAPAPLKAKRGYLKTIVHYFLQFRHAPFVKLSNARIAEAVGCSRITVIRATNWLHEQGYITKSQENLFSINNYALCHDFVYDTKYEAWLNIQSETIKEKRMHHVVLPETDTPNRVLLEFKVLFTSPYRTNTRMTPARARGTKVRKGVISTNRQEKYEAHIKEKRQMVTLEARTWLLAHRQSTDMKAMLEDEAIGLITPTMQEAIKLMHLKPVDYLKMVVYDEPILRQALAKAKKANNLNRPFGFFMKLCKDIAQQESFTPQWSWYHSVCEILGIEVPEYEPIVRDALAEPDNEPVKRSPINTAPKKGRSGTPEPAYRTTDHYSSPTTKFIQQRQERESWTLQRQHSWWMDEIRKINQLIEEYEGKPGRSEYENPDYLRRMLANAREEIRVLECKHNAEQKKEKRSWGDEY